MRYAAWLLSLALACRPGDGAEPGPAPAAAPTPTAAPAPVAAAAAHEVLPTEPGAAGESLYQLAVQLEDQAETKVALSQFRGHPVLIAMFYASCPHACPMLVSKIRRIEQRLTPQARAGLRVLLVSFDGQRDTPEVLRTAAERQGVDLKRWRLARAEEADVRQVAAVLGVKYRRLSDGSFNHSSLITLLDAAGRPAGRLEGLTEPEAPLVARIESLGGAP